MACEALQSAAYCSTTEEILTIGSENKLSKTRMTNPPDIRAQPATGGTAARERRLRRLLLASASEHLPHKDRCW